MIRRHQDSILWPEPCLSKGDTLSNICPDGAISLALLGSEWSLIETFRSPLAARSRLLTLLILLVNPRLRRELAGLSTSWLSGVASRGLEAACTIEIRPHGSLGVTGVWSCGLPLLLALEERFPYFLLGTRCALICEGSWLLVVGIASAVEGLGYCGIGCCAVYSREYAVRSRAIWRYAPTSVIARLTGRMEGLPSSSSVAPSTFCPSVRLLRTSDAVRPT